MDPLDAPPPPPDVARHNAAVISIDITDKITKAASGEYAHFLGRGGGCCKLGVQV